jgi:hypothetical protein
MYNALESLMRAFHVHQLDHFLSLLVGVNECVEYHYTDLGQAVNLLCYVSDGGVGSDRDSRQGQEKTEASSSILQAIKGLQECGEVKFVLCWITSDGELRLDYSEQLGKSDALELFVSSVTDLVDLVADEIVPGHK